MIIKQQSGFRFKRQTKDNLAFLIQKTQESFSRKKKVAAVFFDISQAFDKVWHCGLIKKLIDHKIPIIYIKWLMEFLKHRLFCVQINSFKTNFEPISVGVPQGAVLSPLLFSLYINDIPILNIKNKSYSLLFADDLVTFFIFKKNKVIEKQINNYISLIEKWLNKWRLTMQSHKSNLIVFNKSGHKSHQEEIRVKLFEERIPTASKLKFLGITLDIGLTFHEHAINIKKKCRNRLNVIKILTNKSWKLNKHTLTNIYISLIRSIIDYSSLIFKNLAKNITKSIQAIQNNVLRCTTSDIHESKN